MKKKGGNALRDELITNARYGKITPQEAEVKAKVAGLSPLATQPDTAKFDPMTESRWPIVMAIAWIAWRDPRIVMEQRADFRSLCTLWVFREWNEPVQNGQSFEKREGWFLEPWYRSTAVGLTFLDAALRSTDELPESARLTPTQAERELWHALSEQQLQAEGFDQSGALVEIPAREWTHLKIFEERNQDVFKYAALDRDEPFTDVRFRRADLVSLWPRYYTVDVNSLDLGPISELHLEPIIAGASHVPLSVALCWVITHGGTTKVSIRDEEAWRAAVRKLLPNISDGSIEVIGRDEYDDNRPLPAVAFASIAVPSPVGRSLSSIFAESEAHIDCHLFSGEDEWRNGYNDQFIKKGRRRPRWTHLQVRREHVLKLWPKPDTKSKTLGECKRWLAALMRQSRDKRLKSKEELRTEAQEKFGLIAKKQFQKAWEAAIEESGATGWSTAGRIPAKSYRSPK